MVSASSLSANGPAAADRPVAEARGVTKRYGPTVALEDVTVAVVPGAAHALVGRNGAGKSTLVGVLTGLTRPDAGVVRFGGEPAPPFADRDGWRRRVACVYQKSTVIPTLSVAENLFINRQSTTRSGLIGWRGLYGHAEKLLSGWDVDVDPRRMAADLTVEQRQMVEIARALSFGARFIILDEPTAQLDGAGIERLFGRIRQMREQGVTFLYISHHLQEIYEICETVTVLRDARHIVTNAVRELSHDDLVEAMTGEAVGLTVGQSSAASHRPPRTDTRPVLDVVGLGRTGEYEDVTFQVRAGEVLGVAGAGGSGKAALGETIVGLRTPRSGEVRVGDRRVRPGSVPDALAAGIGFVPQDRHRQGLVPLLSLAENVTLTITERLGRAGMISVSRRRERAERLIRDLVIKTSGPEQPVANLSGGNQQKVVMARALAGNPKVLVLVSPTVGVDVRSKETLLQVVDTVAGEGTAVVLASDELDDLRRCDRVLVMFQGRVVQEFRPGWDDAEMVAAMEGVGPERGQVRGDDGRR